MKCANTFIIGTILLVTAMLALASPSSAQYVITEIIDATGDGAGNTLYWPVGIAVDSSGNVYLPGYGSNNAFKITPGGTITEIIDATGDGGGNSMFPPYGVAVDSSGNVYVTGFETDNAFKIQPVPVPALSNQGLVFLAASLVCAALWLIRRQRVAST
jgi:hypothetical protein